MSVVSNLSEPAQSARGHSLEERLGQYPQLRQRFEEILGIVETPTGGCQTADEAERQTIVVVRQLGQEILTAWTKTQAESTGLECADKKGIQESGKKNCIGIAPLAQLK